jgi:alkylation response protein AidB-like acyl-CoA dehydrogenase
MYPPFYSKQNLNFTLHEVLNVTELLKYPYYQDHNKETFDLVLDSADSIATKLLRPLLTEMDRKEPQLVDGNIKIHPGMAPILKKFGEDGWINAAFSFDEGGQQLPSTILTAAAFIFQAANYSASVFPFLTSGAANLIRSFGNDVLKEQFLPKMYSGHWQGTMALTEPGAGSSLSDIITKATPTEKAGVYKISGQKIYISAGDHDLCDNIVHLMLAKIEGGPVGAKGISLFVVPKYRISEANQLEINDVDTAGIYHKMGYKGAPIAHLMMGAQSNCEGYLVGEAHQGLKYMFQMMNEARLGVGMNAVAIATAAYYASLQYAIERPQGRLISDKDISKPQIPIIEHADVKRMLLFQKAIVEGSLALILQCSQYADHAQSLKNIEKNEFDIAQFGFADKAELIAEIEKYELLLDLLTPIAKSYPSEMGCLSTSAAVQILGGAGYTTDFPVEQYYREARIHPIHEGTTGIHGLDLLGRKIIMKNGKAIQLFGHELIKTINIASKYDNLAAFAGEMQQYFEVASTTTKHLMQVANKDVEEYLSDATLYLEMLGILVIGWSWLSQGIAANKALENDKISRDFYEGKLHTLTYFFEYEIIKIDTFSKRLMSNNNVTIEMKKDWF